MQGKLENASSWVGRPSPVLGLVAHYNHTSHRERMPVLGLAAPSPVLGLVAHYNHTSHAVRSTHASSWDCRPYTYSARPSGGLGRSRSTKVDHPNGTCSGTHNTCETRTEHLAQLSN